MKKKTVLIMIGIILFSIQSVYAKDTIISMNKYENEIFYRIENSYQEDNTIDGSVILGKITEKETNHFVLVKYNANGKLKWMVKHPIEEDSIDPSLLYTRTDNQIDGYLMILPKGLETTFIKVDFKGNQEWEKTSSFHITKIREVKTGGYIACGYNATQGVILLYDNDFNIVWMREFPSHQGVDVATIYEEEQVKSFVLIRKNAASAQLVQFDKEGTEEKIIEDSLTKYDSTFLGEDDTGILLYGSTSEVKLKKGEKSYFIIHYDGEENWETIGNVPVNEKKKIIYYLEEEKPFLFYINSADKTAEVVQFDEEGFVEKKVKKINSEYYDIEDFYVKEDILYLVGQINCPSDDECDYNKNSLFIISDEDVVIEVKDNSSKAIAIIIGVIFLLGIIMIIFHKKKKV